MRTNESSFAKTVNTMESDTEIREWTLDSAIPAKVCSFCEAEHTLESCAQLKKKAHREKIAFFKENGICFAWLCIGHISKDCRKRLSCQVCSFKHPTMLHIQSREEQTEPEAEQRSGTLPDRALVSSDLTGAVGFPSCQSRLSPRKQRDSDHLCLPWLR